MAPIVEAADPCPECGGWQAEHTGYPETHDGRCRVWLVCHNCGHHEDLGLKDGVL